MAATRRNRASRSDNEDRTDGKDPEFDDIPLGVRVHRQPATGPADQPGTIHVAACHARDVEEFEGAEGVDRLPSLIADLAASVWIDLVAPTSRQADEVGKALGLHPLIVEDVLEGNRRAKIETANDVVHVVLFHLSYGDSVIASEVDLVLGERFLLSVHSPNYDPRAGHHLAGGLGPIMSHGPDHLLWAISDDLVDGYFPFTDRIGDAIDDVQDEVVRKADKDTIERVFTLKRELIQVRRAISPVREVFNQLTNRDEELIDEDEIIYFRDIYDHVIRATEWTESLRDLVTTIVETNLTEQANRMNLIMKKVTSWAAIIAVPTAITGWYGQNVPYPGFGKTSGLIATSILIVVMALGLYVLFRRKDWL